MQDKTKAILARSSMFDRGGALSLTNLLLLILIVRIAVTQTLDWQAVCLMFLALANHHGEKWLTKLEEDRAKQDIDRLKALEAEIKAISAAMNLKGLSFLK